MDFDLDSKKIEVATKASDNDGKPLYEWQLDSNLGEIKHIKRIPLVDPEKIRSEDQAKAVADRIHADASSASHHVTEHTDAAAAHAAPTSLYKPAAADVPSETTTHIPAAATTHVPATTTAAVPAQAEAHVPAAATTAVPAAATAHIPAQK